MELKRSGSQPSQNGPAEHFTGTVRVDPLFQSSLPARAAGAYVSFEPCARSEAAPPPAAVADHRLRGVDAEGLLEAGPGLSATAHHELTDC